MNSYPNDFDEIQNLIIDRYRQGLLPPKDIDTLQQWLMSDGWDYALVAWEHEALVLNLAELAEDHFSDHYMKEEGWVFALTKDINEERISFARGKIENAINGGAGEHSLSVHSCPIKHSDGTRLILGLTVEIQGHSPEPIWHGIFADKEAFHQYLKGLGYVFHRDLAGLKDQGILALWRL